MINEAVDQFISDKKLWFRDLHREHKDEIEKTAIEKGNNFLPNTALHIGKTSIPVSGELNEEDEQFKKIIKEKTLELEERFRKEQDEKGSEDEQESESDPEDKWDAETILSTYTNTDNHPSVIKFVPRVKVNSKVKIELHKQFKVPVDGLNGLIPIAEEIEVKKKEKKKNQKQAFEEDSSEEEEEEKPEEDAPPEEADDGTKELNPRKAAKKAVKAERRERRKQKKELKVAFKT